MKVAVLMGGKSFEREVSLASGKVVCEALEEAGHKVVPLDTNADLVPTLRSERPDVVYNALHGKHGEDGTIQSLLEFLGIPFVGSPASVCHRAWNKDALHSSLAKYRDLTGEEGCASWPQGVYLARDAFKGMGAATALPEPPFSTNTTNATGQLLSSTKPANIAFAVCPSRSAVPDLAQTERPPNCQSP